MPQGYAKRVGTIKFMNDICGLHVQLSSLSEALLYALCPHIVITAIL